MRIITAAALIVLALPASAQQQTSVGIVTDASGTPVAGAAVRLLDDPSVVAITSGTGAFRLPGGPGTRVVVTRIGYRVDTVTVTSGVTGIALQTTPLAIDAVVARADAAFTTASSRVVRDIDIHLRPRESSQELLRLAPGLVIAQHAGGGKAEQIFLRGFDVDHGTDVSISVDGLPVNMVSHAHGQGYADLHFVMPELIDRIDVRKGSFDVRDGDFATAGSVRLHTRDRIDGPQMAARAGSFNTAHALAMAPLGSGTGAGGYVAGSVLYSDGPFDAPQRHRRGNAFAKWTAPRDGMEWFAQASAFAAEWDASGQIPIRSVQAGEIDRFGAVDPTEGGVTARADVSVGARALPGPDAAWSAQLFATRYTFGLFSNFTFFLNDAEQGDGIEQRDERWIVGGRATYAAPNRIGRWSTGAELRADRADVALHSQAARLRRDTRSDARIAQEHAGAWVAQEIKLGARTRVSAGLRGDVFHFDVQDHLDGIDDELAHASGSAWRAMVSPRVSLAFDATPAQALYINIGTGFHSNDARDVILAGRSERVLPRSLAAEVGSRRTWNGGTIAASLWTIALESELVFVGDEGVTEASGRTLRHGVDLEARVRMLPWLWVDADLNFARGRFTDEPAGADHIPLAPRTTATAGLTIRDSGPVEAGLRMRHIGERPADETDDVKALGYTVFEAFAQYRLGRVDLTAAVDNLFDTTWNEAQFATTSRLHHEPDPVTELHFTPGAPRSIQLGLRYRL